MRAHQDPVGPGPGRPAEALPYGKGDRGYSPRTIAYYRTTLALMTQALAKPYTQVTSDDLRAYLAEYKQERAAGKVTIGNIRRIMSSCQMLKYIQ
ncbi:phage integrase N-terminal SAM-like domain-containing protein [Olsenella sp. oral taxon 807]|uniref:phage integrase N-terminal SAM-like domain-containing protein n=1 Tax=Olsenella sp. oral taxon 807 TaxID=712411 RepID=UPI0035281DA6